MKAKPQKPLNIIFLGDPAAGKATQSALLVKKYKLYDLDMGKELRGITNQRLRTKFNFDKTIDKGKLAATDLVREILEDRIKKVPKQKGILFDGTPKMLGEARLVKSTLESIERSAPLVIYLRIPLTESIKRVSSRKEYFYGKFNHRADDNVRALKNRVSYYRKNIANVVKFFKKNYHYKLISGQGTIAQVHQRILKAVEQFEKRSQR